MGGWGEERGAEGGGLAEGYYSHEFRMNHGTICRRRVSLYCYSISVIPNVSGISRLHEEGEGLGFVCERRPNAGGALTGDGERVGGEEEEGEDPLFGESKHA